ncbi:hypothetical protein MiSe_49980 [Microseira wollei NIES-4236]|uniref:Uncharacterized protein n=1 Tax=Microseira wollei NIES-4236 TaxID=2530354 RepID=A0AAV3XE71_9CYAN|nr:hypothetical protein MiSe_49980 [Microseira wollei NIES-4236]
MALLGSAVVTRVIGNDQGCTTNQSNYLLPITNDHRQS